MLAWLLAAAALAADPALVEATRAALTPRHDVSCEAVAALGSPDAVRDALIAVAHEAAAPPWVPMRAAGCVVERAALDPVALDAARRWATDPELPGLALVVAGGLDDLAPERAVELADALVLRADRRFALYARPLLAASRHPAVVERADLLPR